MSRRKQPRPRSVKVISEEDDFPENPDIPFEDNNNNDYEGDKNDNIDINSNNNIIDERANTTRTSDNTNSPNNKDSAQTPDKLSTPLQQPPGPSADDASSTPNPEDRKKSIPGPSDVHLGWSLQLRPGVSGQQVRSSVPHHQATLPLVPPNFLLSPPSSSSSVPGPLFPTRYLPPLPHLIANPFTPPHPPPPLHPPPSSSSLPTSVSAFDEMARRKKSPKSIAPWRMRYSDSTLHEDSNSNNSTSSSTSKSARCQMCPVTPADGSSPPPLPVEGHEYFIDPDGTLTIKNGVCPRNLALMLFTHVFANQGRYETLLSENLVKFLLNLKQIVEKHQFMCPTESPLQWANAQNVLKEYVHGSSLQLFPSTQPVSSFGSIHSSNPRKRLHQDDLLKTPNTGPKLSDFFVAEDDNEAGESKLLAGQGKGMRDRSGDRTHIPDNFLVEQMPTPSPSPSHSPPLVYKTSQSARKEKKSPDSGLALTPSGSERDHRDGASDSGSVGGASSRVTSPAPSMSSVASSLSLAEAAKQMANTKRGSKILPIASGDGGTRYLCPVCALELPNDHDLTVHIRSHNSQSARGQVTAPNSCTICGKTLSSQSSLDRHMLVHSGERPFRCKICDMSFTTNGNMHRHARIHEKNGSSTPKPPGRKPAVTASSNSQPSSSSTSSSKASRNKKEGSRSHTEAFHRESTSSASSSGIPPLMAEFGSDKLNLFKSQQDQSAMLQYYNDMSLRMGQLMFPFGSHHPAFPYQHMMAESTRLPYLSPMLNPFTGEVLAKRARLSSPASSHAMMAAAANALPLTHLAREIAREPSPDLRAQQSVLCQLCPRTFTSQWSLDAHMESHVIVDEQMEEENDCAKCKICKTVAKSEESLLLHTLTHHPSDKDLSEPDSERKSPSPKSDLNQNTSSPSPSAKPGTTTSPTSSGKGSNNSNTNNSSNNIKSDNIISNNNQGFQNLNFASFTSKKFPLIAKAFCEEECDGADRAFKLPVYPCSQCELEFPVEGARDLHEVSHLPEEYTVCPTCKCHFSSSSQLQLHMLKHVSDLHFEESRDSESHEGNSMSQTHFLAQFGLVTKDIVMLPSVLEGFPDIEEEKHSDDSKDVKTAHSEGKSEIVQQIKQEMEAVKKEETTRIVKDNENDSLGAERDQENKEGLIETQSYSYIEMEKSSTSSSLKISSSLFGGKPALKVSCSRSPSPLSISGSEPGLEDLSLLPSFSCKHCRVVLSSPQALKHHQRTHHEAAQFRCQVCSYTSTDKSTLLRHMRTHSGERPYKCAVCDYSFTTKANCERHLRQKHGFERDQMSGKIKCNQYIISSSSLSANISVDDENDKSEPSQSKCSSPLSTTSDTRCPTCHVDFFNVQGLKQHLQTSPGCRKEYLCLKCKVTFSSRKALISHMSKHHPSVPAQDYNRFTASLEKTVDETLDRAIEETNLAGLTPALVTPPPAHSHTKEKTPAIASFATDLYQSHQKQIFQNLPANLLALLPKGLFEPAELEGQKDSASAPGFDANVQNSHDDQPLDFSSTGRNKQDVELSGSASASGQKKQKKKSYASYPTGSEDNSEDEVMSLQEADGPIDLSITSVPKQHSQQTSAAEVKAVNLTQAQTISPNQYDKTSGPTNVGMKIEDKYLPLTLSALYNANSNSDSTEQLPFARLNSSKTAPQLSPFNHSLRKPKKFDTNLAQPQTISQKHPAFPQFISMMTSPAGQTMVFQGVPMGAAPTGLNVKPQDPSSSTAHMAMALNEKMATSLPNNMALHPSVFPTGIPMTVLQVQGVSKSGSAGETSKTRSNMKAEGSTTAKGSHRESRQTKQGQEQGKNNLSWAHQQKTLKGKGSSSESDSSCDLASVNKILDATDAQRFQGFLNVANEDDEQDYRSESIESGEDSNTSLENMYSKSLTSGESLTNRSKTKDTHADSATDMEDASSSQQDVKKSEPKVPSEEDVDALDQTKVIPSVTVNVALVDPIVFDKDMYAGDKLDLSCKKQSKTEVSDPNNMSEQAIAALIEKVSRENICSPAKKKRNSYADSPHKFSCPYCSRCFPWLSSLNRHLLTHTGQKPFKCPRCPVTFSTKSNRERHLIRKHNVNMSDVTSRAILDRPYKCHLCAFGAFSTSSNLTRHYRDRHPELSPLTLITDDGAGSDGETEDISYEDEEEYNSLAEQASMRGLSDKDIMLQNYSQDGDDDHSNSSNNNVIKADTHKKRNAVFTIDTPENGTKVAPTTEKFNGFVNKGDNASSNNGITNGRNNLALFSTNKYSASTRPGIDDTVLTDTMKNFLDKSVRQALEDSQRRAMEEGSKFVITPAIERHLRSLSTDADSASGPDTFTSANEDTREESAQCVLCDKDFPTHESLITHVNQDHELELPYRCHLCEMAFCSRLECLQHLEDAHRVQWADICVRNNIGNIQVFATRLDKMIKKISKRQNGSSLASKQDLNNENGETSETTKKTTAFQADSQEVTKEGLADVEKDVLHGLEGDKQAMDDSMNTIENSNHQEDNSSDDGSDQSFCERNGDAIRADVGVMPEVAKDDYLQRKFYCSVCPKRYWSVLDLRTHMRSHTGERPHECCVCGRRFSLKNSLTRHMYRHHPDQISEAKKSGREDLPTDKTIEPQTHIETGGFTSTTSPMKCDQVCSEEEKKKDPQSENKSNSNSDREPCNEDCMGESKKETAESTGADEDMLHDLLGVESSTIDQIFDAHDSAASLLGV